MPITASPLVANRACIGERICPKLRAFTMILTLESCEAIDFNIATVLSVEWLSMKMCSYGYVPMSAIT